MGRSNQYRRSQSARVFSRIIGVREPSDLPHQPVVAGVVHLHHHGAVAQLLHDPAILARPARPL